MSNKAILARTVMILLPMLFLLLGTFAARGVNADEPANPVTSSAANFQGKCPGTKATDDNIVRAIQEKIKADDRFNDQRKHINVSSKSRVVTLEGWVRGADQVKALIALAQNTECVKNRGVITSIRKRGERLVLLKPGRIMSCGPGQKRCCDGCILISSPCHCME